MLQRAPATTIEHIKQLGLGLNLSTKKTRKREFLEGARWCKSLRRTIRRPKTGRPPFGIEMMLRIHCLQQWFGLSDAAMEEALRDVPLYREFARQTTCYKPRG